MPPPPRTRLPASRFIDRLSLIWTAIFYLSLGLSLAATFTERTELLRRWDGAAILALSGAVVALFQIWLYPFYCRPGRSWPMPPRLALGYFGGQALLLAALLALDPNFIGLGFALMGQVLGALRPRSWPLPLLAFLGLIAFHSGLLADLRSGSWLSVASLIFFMLLWVVIALLIARLFEQRYQLLDVVGELQRAKAAIEAGAAQQEELAILRERTRLARDMHDSLGHALVVVNVKLEAAQRLYRVDPARGDAELEATRSLVRETMAALRRSLQDLRAPLADHHDLPAALRRLAAEAAARSALDIQVEIVGPAEPPAELAAAMLQIAREALLNIERHAAAAGALLRLARTDAGWLLQVSDDGSGIDPAALDRPGHFGVVGMRERAAALGGTLSVARRPAGGTLVELRLPTP